MLLDAGESFGGLLALELAVRCPGVDRLVLVNPVSAQGPCS